MDAISRFFKKVWAFIKTYWQLLLGIFGTIFAVLLFKKRERTLSDQYKQLQAAHDAEVKKIDEARREERAAHEANLKKLNDTLAIIQLQYDVAKKQLDDSKKKEISEIIKAYSDKPEELAHRLSETTGFHIILPKE